MNKNNKLLVGILTFVVVCVIGYALFSETITVTGTATTGGSFDIVGTCSAGVDSMFVQTIKQEYNGNYAEGGYVNDSCSFNGDKGVFSVELEYPGANRYFTVKLTNNGTISALVGEPALTYIESCLADTCVEGEPTSTIPDVEKRLKLFKPNVNILGVQVGNNAVVPFIDITQEIGLEFLDSNENIILKPGNSIYYAFRAELDSSVGLDQSGTMSVISNTVSFEFPFTQIIAN